MKQFIKHHPWQIIEEGFDAHLNQISESLCSIGNGRMGQRANFEEHYSGKSLSGTYLAGVYYPDKTRVGWWKNGYPEYFAKVLNAPNFIGIDITINDVRLDLATCKVLSFNRILDMKAGLLTRNFVAQMTNGVTVTVHAQRLFSIIDDECAAIQYSFSTDVPANVTVKTLIDADVRNADANYDEMFWNILKTNADVNAAYIIAETKKTLFKICVAYKSTLHIDGLSIDGSAYTTQTEAGHTYQFQLPSNTKAIIEKYCTVTSNQNHEADKLDGKAIVNLTNITTKGYNKLVNEQAQAWAKKWAVSDIVIEGDVAAQQGIRFNIFQLNQTYTGQDERLNIGPKGFTGEKYGGSTYWDTEAYCIPFFLSTANPAVSRNLLVYRYKHLQKAIENAVKLGFKNGAALYPMVTMNGEECHNEWEITFEEIHRNGAIAYAIYNYINYTADSDYLADYGLEVLLGIARFWAQRISYSTSKKKYVMLGVTGPNEYENNVNNNWYTNYISVWCLKYTLQAIDHVKANNKKAFKRIISDCNFDSKAETVLWKDIIKKMYLPFDKDLQIMLQQEGYLDKEQVLVSDLPATNRPLNQKWSWDRILRSCFIKQADVLQGIYFFQDDFDKETTERNFDFYEKRTVHESSLSPCVHSILACRIGRIEKAYEMYLRTSRLDLDDYNNDTEDGCHTTSMAGTWMSIVEGFGGMRVKNDVLHFNPMLPKQWQSLSFKILYRNALLQISLKDRQVTIENQSGQTVQLAIYNEAQQIKALQTISAMLKF